MLLKPNKPADQSKSYRPISLLLPMVKILEQLIHPILQNNIPLGSHQHGHSTTTALHFIIDSIQRGLNMARPNMRKNWTKLQVSQNTALRTATECHLMSSRDDLHQETNILPIW